MQIPKINRKISSYNKNYFEATFFRKNRQIKKKNSCKIFMNLKRKILLTFQRKEDNINVAKFLRIH
jgi:hypothetical protein